MLRVNCEFTANALIVNTLTIFSNNKKKFYSLVLYLVSEINFVMFNFCYKLIKFKMKQRLYFFTLRKLLFYKSYLLHQILHQNGITKYFFLVKYCE